MNHGPNVHYTMSPYTTCILACILTCVPYTTRILAKFESESFYPNLFLRTQSSLDSLLGVRYEGYSYPSSTAC